MPAKGRGWTRKKYESLWNFLCVPGESCTQNPVVQAKDLYGDRANAEVAAEEKQLVLEPRGQAARRFVGTGLLFEADLLVPAGVSDEVQF